VDFREMAAAVIELFVAPQRPAEQPILARNPHLSYHLTFYIAWP
jgi:hypothetical protein